MATTLCLRASNLHRNCTCALECTLPNLCPLEMRKIMKEHGGVFRCNVYGSLIAVLFSLSWEKRTCRESRSLARPFSVWPSERGNPRGLHEIVSCAVVIFTRKYLRFDSRTVLHLESRITYHFAIRLQINLGYTTVMRCKNPRRVARCYCLYGEKGCRTIIASDIQPDRLIVSRSIASGISICDFVTDLGSARLMYSQR